MEANVIRNGRQERMPPLLRDRNAYFVAPPDNEVDRFDAFRCCTDTFFIFGFKQMKTNAMQEKIVKRHKPSITRKKKE